MSSLPVDGILDFLLSYGKIMWGQATETLWFVTRKAKLGRVKSPKIKLLLYWNHGCIGFNLSTYLILYLNTMLIEYTNKYII